MAIHTYKSFFYLSKVLQNRPEVIAWYIFEPIRANGSNPRRGFINISRKNIKMIFYLP
jgi:hypothetical protein